jgi:NADH-quinone oxidoreductase subunit M
LIREFGGIAKVMPIYTALFVIVTMSSVGVPGTNGFVGEFMVIMGTFVSKGLGSHAHVQAILAALGVILAAVYMLSVVQRVFFGPLDNPKNQKLTDINVRETLAVAPLIAMVFVLGLAPNIVLSKMGDAVDVVTERYREGRMTFLQLDDAAGAQLQARRGGPLERGYPTPPKPKADASETAMNTEVQK